MNGTTERTMVLGSVGEKMENRLLKIRRRGTAKSAGKNAVLVLLTLFLALQVFPLYWLFVFSFKTNREMFAGKVLSLPERWRLENYGAIFRNGDVLTYLFNSTVVTAVTMALTLSLGALAAYALVRMRWRFRGAMMALFLVGIMVPLHAALLPVFLVLSKLKLLNTQVSLILPYAAFALPVGIFIYSGFLKSIPLEMEESAFLDGAGAWSCFGRIIFPLLAPAAATVAVLTFLSSWNELMFAVTFISDRAHKTLPVGVISLASKYRTEWGAIGAALFMGLLPSLLIYALLSGQVQKSILSGAIKG